ncbi:MAG TPA: hypothetical protein V6C96_00215 [Vampirovibrionales bacterium]
MAKFFKVGTIRKTKSGKETLNFNQVPNKDGEYHTGNLVQLHRKLTEFIKNPEKGGFYLQLQDPRDAVKKLAASGYIEESEVASRIESIPSYILQEVTLVVD